MVNAYMPQGNGLEAMIGRSGIRGERHVNVMRVDVAVAYENGSFTRLWDRLNLDRL